MNSNFFSRSIALVLALSMTACGQYRSASPASGEFSKTSGVGGINQPMDTTEIEKASSEAQIAMDEATKTLNSVVDDNGKINILGKASSSEISVQKVTLANLKDKIIAKLDLVVAKIALVKDKFNQARQMVADAIAKLNPADPAQAALIAQLTEQLSKLDLLEQKFFEGVHKLAEKLDFVMAKLDQLVATANNAANSVNPILGVIVGAATWLIIGQIKEVITHFRDKLMAL